jgi:hypothetical protein
MNERDIRPEEAQEMLKRIFAVATLLATSAKDEDMEPVHDTKNRHKNPESDDLGYGESEAVVTSEE